MTDLSNGAPKFRMSLITSVNRRLGVILFKSTIFLALMPFVRSSIIHYEFRNL